MSDKLLVMTGDQVTCAIEAIYSDAVGRMGMPPDRQAKSRWESMLRKELDPLHARARAAIERLGRDGSRLETAVAVFGWGSDEANGSLLGLARDAHGCPSLRCGHKGGWDKGWDRYGVDNPPGLGHGCVIASFGCATEEEALVAALEEGADRMEASGR
jgi:hypothetical protein